MKTFSCIYMKESIETGILIYIPLFLPILLCFERRWLWFFAFMFSLICTWTNGWANNRDDSDSRWHRASIGYPRECPLRSCELLRISQWYRLVNNAKMAFYPAPIMHILIKLYALHDNMSCINYLVDSLHLCQWTHTIQMYFDTGIRETMPVLVDSKLLDMFSRQSVRPKELR